MELTVEVVAALPGRALRASVSLPAGSTLREAVERSGLLEQCPELQPPAALGVFGRRREPDEPVAAGDRIEIYRPLPVDPKERRRAVARGR